MDELDSHVRQPTRLRLMTLLSGAQRADFNFLRSTMELTKGNLSAHMSRLGAAGSVSCRLIAPLAVRGRLARTPKCSPDR